MLYARHNTAKRVQIGPYMNSSTASTEKTALTIANTDIQLSKNGTTWANKNNKGAYHNSTGWYWATLDTTDFNTIGSLQLKSHKAGALPVLHEYTVLGVMQYDAMFGSTDYLWTDIRQVQGTTQNTVSSINSRAKFRATILGGTTSYACSANTRAKLRAAIVGGVTSYACSVNSRAKLREAIIDDATRIDGSRVNQCATVNGRAALRAAIVGNSAQYACSVNTRAKIRNAIVDDATRIDASRLNTCATVNGRTGLRAAIVGNSAQYASSVNTRAKIRAALVDDNTRLDGSRLNTCPTTDTRAKIRAAILSVALPASPTADSVGDYLQRLKYTLVNRMKIQETTGHTATFADDNTTVHASVDAAFTSAANITLRKKME